MERISKNLEGDEKDLAKRGKIDETIVESILYIGLRRLPSPKVSPP